MLTSLLSQIRRGLSKPPHVLVHRVVQEARRRFDRTAWPWSTRTPSLASLLRQLGDANLSACWNRLAQRPFPGYRGESSSETNTTPRISKPVAQQLENQFPGEVDRLVRLADAAIQRRVTLLGSGEISLGIPTNWHLDHKTGLGWPIGFSHEIDYVNRDRPSDVKVPWEISRLQWLIPAGQAYLLTGDEKYAVAVRDVLADWITANPCLQGVNWACTMEVGLRLLTWTWFFQVFHASHAWQDENFREQFLTTLFAHGLCTERYLEYSDVNGNHCTADGAGLVFAGLFFGTGTAAHRWSREGWRLLRTEIVKQVFPDGVDFEASVPYHRLVAELFLWPVLYRRACGKSIPTDYADRLRAMGQFTKAYCQPGGTVPVWGDADDARALPLGNQQLNDHRYLAELLDDDPSATPRETTSTESFWISGPASLRTVTQPATHSAKKSENRAVGFSHGGFYILRNEHDHVFIDCGPVGLKGRGGHGHNDCLGFEAVLTGVKLIQDCGSFVYTANFEERNRFRSTDAHNTPMIDGEEQNRFIAPDNLWQLHNDARPFVKHLESSTVADTFLGGHTGYERLANPVTVSRAMTLKHETHELEIADEFTGTGSHAISSPLHLAIGVQVRQCEPQRLQLQAGEKEFEVTWTSAKDWTCDIEPCRISTSYGVAEPSQRIVWKRNGSLTGLTVRIAETRNRDRHG